MGNDALRRRLLGVLSPAGSRARLMILTFHQVPVEADPLTQGMPAKIFAEQMRWMADHCNVLPLPKAAERLGDGTLPARAASVTFDDGYADHVEVVSPILRQLGLPATFFITAGAVEQGIMWNDLITEGIRMAPGRFDLSQLNLGVHELSNSSARRRAIDWIVNRLKYCSYTERLSAAEHVFSQASDDIPPRLMMTGEQVCELSRQGFDIGAHTINHPILIQLDTTEARREIEGSRDWLTELTGKRPQSFAYPNGRPGTDFGPEHSAMVREAGYSVGVSTRWGCATKRDSPFGLPRWSLQSDNRKAWAKHTYRTLGKSYLRATIFTDY